MITTKCDLCKKEIKNNMQSVSAGFGMWSGYNFCWECGKPIISFLKKHKLVKNMPVEK